MLYYQDFFLLQIAFLGVFLIFLEFLRNKKGLDKKEEQGLVSALLSFCFFFEKRE